jgi:hypothetical protein
LRAVAQASSIENFCELPPVIGFVDTSGHPPPVTSEPSPTRSLCTLPSNPPA